MNIDARKVDLSNMKPMEIGSGEKDQLTLSICVDTLSLWQNVGLKQNITLL